MQPEVAILIIVVPTGFAIIGWLLLEVWKTKVPYKDLDVLLDRANERYHKFDVATDDARIGPLVTRLNVVDAKIASLEIRIEELHRQNREDLQYIRQRLDYVV